MSLSADSLSVHHASERSPSVSHSAQLVTHVLTAARRQNAVQVRSTTVYVDLESITLLCNLMLELVLLIVVIQMCLFMFHFV